MSIRKILVVDDSPTERHVLTALLTSKGYEVITAQSGEEGIAKAKSELPDLVLMDVVMPGLNGYQATRTLTRDPATRNIPVIVCTTKSQETDKIWGLASRRPGLPGQASQRPGVAGQDRSALDGSQGMSKKIRLHEFQSYLAARLAGTSSQSAAGLLGVQAGPDYWLLDLADSGDDRSAIDTTGRGALDQTLVLSRRTNAVVEVYL